MKQSMKFVVKIVQFKMIQEIDMKSPFPLSRGSVEDWIESYQSLYNQSQKSLQSFESDYIMNFLENQDQDQDQTPKIDDLKIDDIDPTIESIKEQYSSNILTREDTINALNELKMKIGKMKVSTFQGISGDNVKGFGDALQKLYQLLEDERNIQSTIDDINSEYYQSRKRNKSKNKKRRTKNEHIFSKVSKW